ncbi:GerAB/ArcD/ProY family transporter [Alkalicoccobacillus gibsonii]|uniref:GerAB/ArcD/ProY family transporter n=1 Tax=Alkalicoccobacillus gibsonii TaxID=79881 RepID=UPI003F7C960C
MQLHDTPNNTRQLSPFLSFFIIVGVQISVGILGFERFIVVKAGHDAWISIIIAGLITHVIIWMMYHLLNQSNGDLVTIHLMTFGPYIGVLLNLFFICYYALLAYTVICTYTEVLETWMFADVYSWVFTLLILSIAYSYTTKGIRVVTGLAVISLFITFPLIITIFFTLPDSQLETLKPIFNHSILDIAKGAKAMALNVLGLCVLFMIYPFFKDPRASQKWTHLGLFFNISLYTIAMILTISYYSKTQLLETIWPTITLWKAVNLGVIERFEYIGVSLWLFVVLPSICLLLWSATRLLKRVIPIKQRIWLRILCLFLFMLSFKVNGRMNVETLNDITANIGFYVIFGYIPFLFICFKLRQLLKKRRERA